MRTKLAARIETVLQLLQLESVLMGRVERSRTMTEVREVLCQLNDNMLINLVNALESAGGNQSDFQ
jgi:hypothetical protein